MSGTYLYGVVWSDDVEAVDVGRRAVAGAPLRAVHAGPLAVLASDAPGETLEATRDDLMAHAEVLQETAERVTVLPMQFGMVMPGDREAAEELLEARRERLEALLTGLAGRVELELRAAYVEDAVLRDVVTSDAEVRRLRARIRGVSEEAAYYDRIRLGEAVAAAIEQRRANDADAIVSRLEALAVAVRVGTAAREADVLHASFLVESDRVSEFDDAVTGLEEESEGLLRFKYLGPLAPHSFVDLEGEVPPWA
jgi:hypothetical protein